MTHSIDPVSSNRYLKEIEAKREQAKSPETPESFKQVPKPSLQFGAPPRESSHLESDSLVPGKSTGTPGASIFGSGASGKSIFGNTEGNPFLNKSKEPEKAKEEDKVEKLEAKALTFPQATTGTFSFGQSSTTGTSSASFSFGSGKPFSFGSSVVAPQADDTEEKEDEDEPPKADFKPVTEEGAIYEKR